MWSRTSGIADLLLFLLLLRLCLPRLALLPLLLLLLLAAFLLLFLSCLLFQPGVKCVGGVAPAISVILRASKAVAHEACVWDQNY